MLKLFNSVGFHAVKTLKRWLKIQSPSQMFYKEQAAQTINIEDWQQFFEAMEDMYQRSMYYEEEE